MPITALTRSCICHELISDPSAIACPRCERALVPHHTSWPPFFKWWLVSELARRRFNQWLTEQSVWEWLLRDAMVTGGAGPNPRGTHFTNDTPAALLYPAALQLATEWKAAGSTIAQATDLPRRTNDSNAA
jgi:hypothetical protein